MKTVVEAAHAWFNKAQNEADDFDRFVYLWFAFNALYNKYLSTSEKGAINDLLWNEISRTENLKAILNSEDSIFFQNRVIRNCKVENCQDTRVDQGKLKNLSNNDKIRLIALLKIVYQVRCNLFHGNKMFNSESDQNIIKHAANILSMTIPILL